MIKLFERIFWHNNTTPAINEDNLNAMSKAIDDIDNRVIDLGADVMEVVPQIQAYLDQAADLVEAMELLTKNPPYIGANGNWYVWDTETSSFVDSGIDASITVTIADVTMLNYGTAPYITNTGTNTDPIFHLFIPRAAGITSITKTGTSGLVDTYTVTFQDGNTSTFQVTNGKGIVSIAKTSTSGLVDTYTITFNDSTTTTFTVTNGNGDMNKSTYDPQSAVENAGGIPNYVSGAVSSLKSAFTNNVNENGSKNFLAMRLGVLKSNNHSGVVEWDGNTYKYAGMTLVCNLVPGTDIVESFTLSGATNSTVPFSFVPICNEMNYNGKAVTVAMIADVTNSNIRVTAFGTNYLYANTTQQKYNYTPTSNVWRSQIYVGRSVTISNPVTFKLMICLKSDYDFDSTWVAPSKTNLQLTQDSVTWDDFSEVGAVNRLENKATSQTLRGNTITVDNDGIVTISGTQDGTGGGTYLHLNDTIVGDGKAYRLSGCPNDGSTTSYRIYIWDATSSKEVASDIGEGAIATLTSGHTFYVNIHIYLNYAISGTLTFKPMIAPVSYNGPYVPYAKTNKELTDYVLDDCANIVRGNANANVVDITCSGNYGLATVFGTYFIGAIAFWSGTYHWIPLVANNTVTVAASNESATGLRLTVTGSVVNPFLIPQSRIGAWAITKVS